MSILITGMNMPSKDEFKWIRIYDDGGVTVECDHEEHVIAHATQFTADGYKSHGKWKRKNYNIYCSVCEFEPLFDSREPLYNFCPNCGCDMRGR